MSPFVKNVARFATNFLISIVAGIIVLAALIALLSYIEPFLHTWL